MSNEFGWCAKAENAPLLEKAGFDYIELPLSMFELENRAAYARHMDEALALGLPVRAFYFFFPQDIRVVGPHVDSARVRNYIALAAQTAAALKARIMVLGSAGARNVPEGWERARAEEQFLNTLHWCADELEGTGVTIAIEPLNSKESNLINSVAEGVEYARKVNRREIRVLADLYHMMEENEPLETLIVNREWLAHIHIADTDRRYPGSGSYDLNRFFGLLKEIGYSGMISTECTLNEEEKEREFRAAKAFIEREWNRV